MLERALTPASVAIRALNQRADVNPMVERFHGLGGGKGANVCIRVGSKRQLNAAGRAAEKG